MSFASRQPSLPPRSGCNRTSDPVRVMIVDDSLIVRSVLSRVIAPEPDIEIVAKSGSAELAIAQLAKTPADVVLLDLEMPGMGGLEALPRILATNKSTQVLVVSSLTRAGAEHTLAALSMGAADTMLKPRTGEFDEAYRQALIGKIRALGSGSEIDTAGQGAPAIDTLQRRHVGYCPKMIAIGASTGGIHALSIFLRNLPASVTTPILVAQHLPSSFAGVFARQLQSAAGREAVVAEDGMPIEPNRIFVASGNGHMTVTRKGGELVIDSLHGPAPSGCTPSVDPLFESAARHAGKETLGVVLSGMGRDGSLGAVKLVEAGSAIIVQDKESAAVWGMPRAIAEGGLADAVLAPDALAAHAAKLCEGAA